MGYLLFQGWVDSRNLLKAQLGKKKKKNEARDPIPKLLLLLLLSRFSRVRLCVTP